MILDYLILSFKNLKRRGVRSWLTLLGIFIGITLVVSLVSLGNSLQLAVMSQFGVSSTQVITVQAGGVGYTPPGSGVVKYLTSEDAREIEKLDLVEVAIPRNIETVKLQFNRKTRLVAAASIPEGEKRKYIYQLLDLTAEKGRLLEKEDSKKIILGYNFFDKDKNGFDKKIVPGKSVLINGRKFKVVGIIEKKGSFILDNVICVGDDDLKELAGYGDEVDLIVVKVKDKDLMNKAKDEIENLLRKRRDVKKGEEDFTVQTPQSLLETVNKVLGGVNVFVIILASISIVVGAIGIANTMTTSILERKREIGIMKAIGARNKDIFLQFFIEAGILGLIGGVFGAIAGTILGYFGAMELNKLMNIFARPEISFSLLFLAIMSSFFIGSIAGVIPAMRAAKQNPVECLRG